MEQVLNGAYSDSQPTCPKLTLASLVSCHQLTVDPGVSDVAQRRRKQSPEKSEAAEKAVKDLLDANFISEAKYTT
ncbi:hypothetical protein MTR_0008s0430 [Medicago truncatula]|uniref:Uncharacterized protein n=1 Tax=Medicago truncatula TaxID=3880 RepID=A0A072TJE6_MEDTR|nr:hypothetical protein MTR_0008s0430 [Medicago truncatula]